MRNETRIAYNTLVKRLGELNGVENASEKFTITPSVQQKLETKIQESSEFLSKINITPVTEMEGEKLNLGISGPVAGPYNTKLADRQTRDLTGLDKNGYKCSKTDFDTHISYGTLDMWAKFPDFQTRVRDTVVQRQALDRMMIGFHGVSIAETTDIRCAPHAGRR